MRSDVSQGELGAVWASADCTQESTGQGMNKDKDHAAGVFATGKRTPEAQRALEAVFRGIAKAREKYPKLQYCIENVGYGALRNEKWITKRFGKGIVVRGCAYGLKSGKTYRLWLSPETADRFTTVDPRSPESCCEPAGPRRARAGRDPQERRQAQAHQQRGRVEQGSTEHGANGAGGARGQADEGGVGRSLRWLEQLRRERDDGDAQ